MTTHKPTSSIAVDTLHFISTNMKIVVIILSGSYNKRTKVGFT